MNMFRGKSRNFRRPANFHHPTACCGGEDSRNFKKFLEMEKTYWVDENVPSHGKLY